MYKIKFFDHTADVGFLVDANTFPELLKGAAIATFDTMTNLKKISPKLTKKIKLKNKDQDKLLFEYIEELIFLKDSDYMLFSKFNIKVTKEKENYVLISEVKGEKINPKKHDLKVDVKAITFHQFSVKKSKDKWKAKIILDI